MISEFFHKLVSNSSTADMEHFSSYIRRRQSLRPGVAWNGEIENLKRTWFERAAVRRPEHRRHVHIHWIMIPVIIGKLVRGYRESS
jgi:hypothetical protein